VARAEGNPLFIEELVRFITESGGFERDRSGSLSLSRSTVLLPPALEGILVARIQQLTPDARRLAQIGAAIGRTFPVAVVRHVFEGDEFDEALTRLLRAEVVSEHRRYPTFECAFRHGLLREAALSTLTPARAKELIRRAAEGYEEAYAEALEPHFDRLAELYWRAGDLPRALHNLERAGTKALELEAMPQAEHLLARARGAASKLGDAESERRIDGLLAKTSIRTKRGWS
jgi:predicted ATPase